MQLSYLLCLLLACSASQAYKYYEDLIPNGVQVPDPCRPNTYWKGVGHEAFSGGGPRNPFGEDFAKNNHVWNEVICMMDSDGDGKRNGEELGDPNCIWAAGSGIAPEHLSGLSHPGICEPMNSTLCLGKNAFEVCTEAGKFECDGIQGSDVITTVIRGVPTKVPPKDTTYICQTVDLPTDGDYHIIAHEPVIDNANVMHHMVLFGCDEEDSSLDKYEKPADCFQVPDSCSESFAGWTLGDFGQCFDGPYGIRIGKNGKKKGILQYHWTNVEKRTDYIDSSGFKLYYTTKLRQYDAGAFAIGQTILTIPPQMPLVEQTAMCTSECTKKLIPEPINLISGNLHMHYLGDSGGMELFRNGKKEKTLLWQDTYDYDSPYYERYNPPYQIKGGDALKITCNFKSTTRTNTTTWGYGTFDEMCFGFFFYYPKIASGYCGHHGDYELCISINDICQASTFINSKEGTDAFLTLAMSCRPDKCAAGCAKTILELQEKHACFRPGPEFAKFMTELYSSYDEDMATDIIERLVSCGLTPSNKTRAAHIPSDLPNLPLGKNLTGHYRPHNNVHTKPTGMSWKDQIEYMKGIRDLACGGAAHSFTWSVWSMILIIAVAKSI